VNGSAPSNGVTEGDKKKKEKSFEGWLSSEFVDKLAKKKDFKGESKHIFTSWARELMYRDDSDSQVV